MENMRNIKMPPGNAAGRLARVVIMGGAAVYGIANSLFNVEGGHRYGWFYIASVTMHPTSMILRS